MIDRSAVMRDAHKRYRRRRGTAEQLTWSQALSRAWEAAKLRAVPANSNAEYRRAA